MYFAEKLTLCQILLVKEGLDKYIYTIQRIHLFGILHASLIFQEIQ